MHMASAHYNGRGSALRRDPPGSPDSTYAALFVGSAHVSGPTPLLGHVSQPRYPESGIRSLSSWADHSIWALGGAESACIRRERSPEL